MKEYIAKSAQTKIEILKDEKFLSNIENVVELVVKAINSGNKILLIGNGGSASDCNHIATEFVSRFYKERKALSAISLTSNNATITAIANDYGYEKIFSRQIDSIGKKGDVLFAFSTSGMSKNIIEALNKATELGLVKIGFSGQNPCDMDGLCDTLLKVPSDDTPIIQESHIMLGHLVCKMVEEKLF